jgi:cell division protein FtsN
VSFVIYLLVVSFINPHIDLSNTAKKDIEVAPNLNESGFNKGQIDNRMNDFSSGGDSYNPYQTQVGTALNQPSNASVEPTSDVSNDNVSETKIEEEPLVEVKQTNQASQDKPQTQQNKDTKTPYTAVPVLDTNGISGKPVNKPAGSPVLDNSGVPSNNTSLARPLNKVMVGSYGSPDEAKQAYEKIVTSGSNVKASPIIKQVNGKYSIQVGAFTDKAKAENMAKSFSGQNYSTTVKSEQ